jgi:DNA-binding CsgD family transcriptional regulator
MMEHFVRRPVAAHPAERQLSDRELEVYRLIGEGHPTRRIADELHLSIKTVETYQAHIKEKLSLRTARELVQHAIESNLTRPRY